jgi:NCAIR mutase (PurE)-related protein
MNRESTPSEFDQAAMLACLEAVRAGRLTPAAAAEQFASAGLMRMPHVTLDLGRRTRCGFAEVIFGEGKSVEALAELLDAQLAHEPESLITRLAPERFASLQMHSPNRWPYLRYVREARTLRVARRPIAERIEEANGRGAPVGVVTAGTTDLPVAEEAIETLTWMGVPVRRFEDCGVAGPQRLLAIVPQLRQCAAIVVAAGMEGALPSVVGGHVAVPVFAVPTSVGYGAAFGGVAALLSMLNSCAANVAVVNIDAGFKAAFLAGLVATAHCRGKDSKESSAAGLRE